MSNTTGSSICISKSRARNFRLSHIVTMLIAIAIAVVITGCHSAYMNATIINHGSSAISVVQVEYPSASFGTQTIAPGQEFKYRFKVLGSGSMKVTYTDTSELEHKSTGPSLKEGDEGAVSVVIDDGRFDWKLALTSR